MTCWRKTVLALGLAGSLALCGCAPMYGPGWESDYPPAAYGQHLYPGYGTVYGIDRMHPESERGNIGMGALAGALVGGLIGHQVGDGRDNTAATIIGAAGGAFIGHQLEQQNQAPTEGYRLTIRMENGSFQTVVQNRDFLDLRVGDRVRIDQGNVRRY